LTILLRTCGGIGNQLFQSNFAILLADKYKSSNIYHLHSENYERVAQWELDILNFRSARGLYLLLLLLRLPRLMTYFKISNKEYVRIGSLIILDGYFLEKSNYELFCSQDIEQSIQYWRRIFDIKKNKNGKTLLHIRLGDFFVSNKERELFLNFTFDQVEKEVDIISNDEDLVLECLRNKYYNKAELCKILSTTNLSSIELLRFVSQYENICYNGSTLLFWGSILGGSSLTWNSNLHQEHYVVKNCKYLDQIMKIFVSN